MKNPKNSLSLLDQVGWVKVLLLKILSKDKNIWLSVSATTREPREGEKEGENYYFE